MRGTLCTPLGRPCYTCREGGGKKVLMRLIPGSTPDPPPAGRGAIVASATMLAAPNTPVGESP